MPDGEDAVAVELPLEIRAAGRAIAVTMRTPGHDEELALGFLFGEGLIDAPRPAELAADLESNTIEVAGPLLQDPGERNFYMSSSCGICGKGAIEEVTSSLPVPGRADRPALDAATLASLPTRLAQPLFDATGGSHATGLFTLTGELVCCREDVGRHNAMDKVIGWALEDLAGPGPGSAPTGLAGRLLNDRILCVSGRLSFELVQKAAMAGAPALVGVGAPSSLAIELAGSRGMTLCGFAREGDVNVYCGEERLRGDG